jgi:hypothetical protein
MTRIEHEKKSNQQLDEMESEIDKLKKQLKHKQSKKFFNCRSCALLIILVVIALGSIFAAILAKSGLWQIPFFSDYFYHQPTAVYVVKPSTFNENNLVNRLQSVVTSEAIKQKKTSNLEVFLKLDEAELTSLLMGQNKEGKALANTLKYGQVAINTSQTQLFFETESVRNLIVTLDFIPGVKDGKLNFKVKKFKIGDLPLPGFIGSFVVEDAIANSLNSILDSFQRTGKIQDITLVDRGVVIKILITNINI